MPYEKISEANPAILGIKPPVTLTQANLIASWVDEIERSDADVESPWAVGISQFRKAFHVEDGKWVKNKPATKEASLTARIRHVENAWRAKYAAGSPYGPDPGWPEEVFEDKITVNTAKGLMAYPYMMQEDGTVEFGEPVQVKARKAGEPDTEVVQGALAKFFESLTGFVTEAMQKITAKEDGSRKVAREAREKRSEKWGVAVLEAGSSLTIPKKYKGATFADFADPTNVKYPVWLTKSRDDLDAEQLGQVRNAPARFAQFKDNYGAKSRGVVAGRIEEALEKFKIGEYAAKGSFIPVVKGRDGKDWWVAYSGTAFEDLDREIISRKAIDFGIAYGDKTGERGDLRLFHLPGSRVGSCEVQLREGCFLIEAGKWDETAVAVATKETLRESPEAWKMSVGFAYNGDYFINDVYMDQVVFLERSVVKANRAASPFTAILVSQEVDTMSTKDELFDLLGDQDLVDKVLNLAAEKTDELSRLVAFKQKSGDDADQPVGEGMMAQIEEMDEETLKQMQEAIAAKLLGEEQDDDEQDKDKGKVAPSVVEIDEGVIKAIAAEVALAVNFEKKFATFDERLGALAKTVEEQGTTVTGVKQLLETDIDTEVSRRLEALPTSRFVLAEKAALYRQSQEDPDGDTPTMPVAFKSPLAQFAAYNAMRSTK